MQTVFLVIHVAVSFLLILIVLLQAGKSGGLGGIFGGSGSSDALFSAPSGSAFLKKLTTSLAIIFMCTSLLLTIISNRRGLRTVTGFMPPIEATPQAEPAPMEPAEQ